MLTLKYGKNVKVAFFTLVLLLILLTEPALAEKARNKASRSGGGSSASQRVQKASTSSRTQRSSNVSKTVTRAPAPSRQTIRQARPSTPRPSNRQSSPRTISKSNTRQVRSQAPSSTKPSYQPRKVVFSRSTTAQPAKVTSGGSKPSYNFSGSKKSVQVSSSAGKQPTISSSNRISPSKTSRIGKAVGGNKPSVAATQKATSGSKPKTGVSSGKTARIGKAIGDKKAPGKTMRKPARNSNSGTGTAKTTRSSNKILRKPGSAVRQSEQKGRTGSLKSKIRNPKSETNVRQPAGSRVSNRTQLRRPSLFTRPANEKSQHIRPANEKSQHVRLESQKALAESRPILSRSRETIARRREHHREGRFSSVRYRERSDVVKRVRRHEHIYVDYRDRICRRIARPRHRFMIYYNWGPYWTFRYVYPYYHRRYIFVSLGGYWPIEYRYVRYYWYGCHPYYWYGYYPIAREVVGDTYNYYTYNYYYDGTAVCQPGQATGDIGVVDHTTFADVREKLAQQAMEEPAEETAADRYFDEAVKAFEVGGYAIAAETFAKAMELAPDDMVLPFAYCQALFAAEEYTEAAEILREALANVSPEEEGVFYPRGLYAEDDILFEQIDKLAEKAQLYSFDADLQLLLGYHLLGIGEIDAAVEPLRLASQDLENAPSAAILLSLLEKMRLEQAEDTGQENTD